ncbi:MAG TPA: putative metallopeptidase [Candidatus Binatia bacterium]|nr:putative metallopeptidase [Candidatus Binatia bacterium]
MPTFQRCPKAVSDLANEILCEFESHKPLLDAKVRIDFVFAYPDYDEEDKPKNDALKLHGVRALGIAKKIALKERALGRGDAEIALDGEWWEEASEEEQKALLDHELHHIQVSTKSDGVAITDDLHRPKITLRKHDYQFGWFKVIAERHGKNAQEVKQARQIFEQAGQLFFPQLIGE